MGSCVGILIGWRITDSDVVDDVEENDRVEIESEAVLNCFGVVNACDVLSVVRAASKAAAEMSWRTIIQDVRDV